MTKAIMTKAPENAPARLFLGDNEKIGGQTEGVQNSIKIKVGKEAPAPLKGAHI